MLKFFGCCAYAKVFFCVLYCVAKCSEKFCTLKLKLFEWPNIPTEMRLSIGLVSKFSVFVCVKKGIESVRTYDTFANRHDFLIDKLHFVWSIRIGVIFNYLFYVLLRKTDTWNCDEWIFVWVCALKEKWKKKYENRKYQPNGIRVCRMIHTEKRKKIFRNNNNNKSTKRNHRYNITYWFSNYFHRIYCVVSCHFVGIFVMRSECVCVFIDLIRLIDLRDVRVRTILVHFHCTRAQLFRRWTVNVFCHPSADSKRKKQRRHPQWECTEQIIEIGWLPLPQQRPQLHYTHCVHYSRSLAIMR